MKKGLLFVLGLVLTVLMFNGCSGSSDDDSHSDNVKNSLIGIWETSMGSNWEYINIQPNGKMRYWWNYEMVATPSEDVGNEAYWAYDESTQSISMYTKNGYYSYTYKVVMNDDKQSWVGIGSNGRTYTFVKAKE